MFINVCVIFHKYVYVFTVVHRVYMIQLVISEVKEQKICEFIYYRLSKKRLHLFLQIKFHYNYFRIGFREYYDINHNQPRKYPRYFHTIRNNGETR